MATREQMQQWLDEAYAARHKLLTGKKVDSVNYNGRMISYGSPEEAKQNLDLYIRDLEVKLGQGRRRAIPVRF